MCVGVRARVRVCVFALKIFIGFVSCKCMKANPPDKNRILTFTHTHACRTNRACMVSRVSPAGSRDLSHQSMTVVAAKERDS